MKRYALGIDIGGTSAKLGLVSKSGRILRRISVKCDNRASWRRLVRDIIEASGSLMRLKPVAGVGVGCAGCVDGSMGIVHMSPNLPNWNNVHLKKILEAELGVPVVLDNDVNMITLGESAYGAARGVRNVFCITIGTGVGGGMLIDGELYRGGSKSAGEIGHVRIVPRGRTCVCGRRGCLERYIGRDGLVGMARKVMRDKKTVLRAEEITPINLEKAARAGDAASLEVWDKAGRYLGIGLAVIVNLLNPDMIVLGGGIGKAGTLLTVPARRAMKELALSVPAGHVRIVKSALGDAGGIVGAAAEIFNLDYSCRR
jgi:glucokinase